MLPSQIKIGIIGGGQLGKMLIEAGQPYNIHYNILETENAPAGSIANHQIIGSLMDSEKIKELANISDVLTFEIEHINVEVLLELEKAGKKIIPSPKILQIIQDKGLQKQFFIDNNIPSSAFVLAENKNEFVSKMNLLNGEKIAVKLRKGGYDGKGVFLSSKKEIQEGVLNQAFDAPCVLEAFIENATEISIIVARHTDGSTSVFPTVEMEFNTQSNLVEFLFSPAQISETIAQKCESVALDCIQKLGGVGLFAVELFVDENQNVFVNEIAPRPHNSGHHTIECCYTSQYEQLNRILLGMPLGSTKLIQPAAMINLIGFEGIEGNYEITGLDTILKIEGVYIHLYNKAVTKPNRKMGHITIMGENIETVKERASLVKTHIGMILK